MAGDWIKMRTVLQSSPKVVRIASALGADRLRTVGGLHSAWCLFDAHSEDGRLDGYTPEVLDSMIGWPGFTEAMASVDWIDITPEALVLPEFDKHNGQSAKRRAQEADRKRSARMSAQASASEADKNGTREEKRREENINSKFDFSVWPQEPSKQVLKDWLSMRKRQKADVSQTVINRLAREFEKAGSRGMTVDDCLSECITRGWRGFKTEWVFGDSEPASGEVRAGL